MRNAASLQFYNYYEAPAKNPSPYSHPTDSAKLLAAAHNFAKIHSNHFSERRHRLFVYLRERDQYAQQHASYNNFFFFVKNMRSDNVLIHPFLLSNYINFILAGSVSKWSKKERPNFRIQKLSGENIWLLYRDLVLIF